MPVQAPPWTDFLLCPICCNEFECSARRPISLACGHTMCKSCLSQLQRKQCPFDQATIQVDINHLPENYALLQLVGGRVPEKQPAGTPLVFKDDYKYYLESKKCVEELALYLKCPLPGMANLQGCPLSRPMQRKLITLINCQLVEEEGRTRSMRTARSLGERTVTELILQHQNPQQLSANLWAAVRARGCQFLGLAMQEEVLKLVLLALEDGSALSRKVLVMFVVQRLAPHFPQASKTSIGHVVQLLYRASCFKVAKREGDSSLMQVKEEFRTYEALRREHDAQIVQIAIEAGLRIAPEQWSSLLYGDAAHKSHMQSIIDKLQTPQSFSQSVEELVIALQRTGDPGNLAILRPHLEFLAGIDSSPEAPPPSWQDLKLAQEATKAAVKGLVEFVRNFGNRKTQEDRVNFNVKYKTSMCRDMTERRNCPRGLNCTFAHSQEELEKFRAKSKRSSSTTAGPSGRNSVGDSAGEYDAPSLSGSSEVNILNNHGSSNVTSEVPNHRFDKPFISENSPCESEITPIHSVHTRKCNIQMNNRDSSSNIDTNPSEALYQFRMAPALNPDSPEFRPSLMTQQPRVHAQPPYSSLPTTILGVIPAAIATLPATKIKLSTKCLPQSYSGDPPQMYRCCTPISSSEPSYTHGGKILNAPPFKDLNAAGVSKSIIKSQYCMLKNMDDGNMVPYYSPWAGSNVFPGESSTQPSASGYNTSMAASSNEVDTAPEELQAQNEYSELDFFNSTIFGPSEKDEFIPFGPPLVSKYGPISRCSKGSVRELTPIHVNAISLMGSSITNPTSAVCHPLPSASFAPSYTASSPSYAVPVALIPEEFLPVVESASVMLPVTVDCTVCLPNDSGLSVNGGGGSKLDKGTLAERFDHPHTIESKLQNVAAAAAAMKEEFWEIEQSIQDRKNLLREGPLYIERSQDQDLKLGATLPTSIGPWPSQTLENTPFKS